VFDFFVDSPGRGLQASLPTTQFLPVTVHFGHADQDFNIGLASVAVPGCLAGYVHVQGRLGRLPLARVVAPAECLAREGVVLNARQAYLVEILQPILASTAAGRRLYQSGGRPLLAGERLVNTDLADFLQRLGSDPDAAASGFSAPGLIDRIAGDMADGGGLLTAADLADYRVHEREPVRIAYRGYELVANPPPALGGVLLGQSLGLLEADGPLPIWGSAEHLTRLAETMIEMETVRARRGAGDPLHFSRGTTHVSVSDVDGNIASMSTSNGESSGYIAPGTGVMLNNMMGEDDLHPDGFEAFRPGDRVVSMMCPSVLLRDGEVVLALGSGGSKRIRSALSQVISNVVDYGMDVAAAIEAPRLHWDGEQLQAEPGFPVASLRALGERWRVNRWEAHNLYFGGVHAVAPGRAGAGDPRRGGAVVVC
jgi:gamma-glutamyltranspeptidase/glutathione hydrolase